VLKKSNAGDYHLFVHYVLAGPLRALADTALATVRAAVEPATFAEAFSAGQQIWFKPGVMLYAALCGRVQSGRQIRRRQAK
jgi:hypothetical protein